MGIRQWDRWADDDDGWDPATGAPSKAHFAGAIQVWSALNDHETSVADAARVFNCDPARIIEVIDEGYAWMYLTGPRDDYERLIIQHEGE